MNTVENRLLYHFFHVKLMPQLFSIFNFGLVYSKMAQILGHLFGSTHIYLY